MAKKHIFCEPKSRRETASRKQGLCDTPAVM